MLDFFGSPEFSVQPLPSNTAELSPNISINEINAPISPNILIGILTNWLNLIYLRCPSFLCWFLFSGNREYKGHGNR